MPKKNFETIGKDELKRRLKVIGRPRIQIASELGVTIGAINKWVGSGKIPEDQLRKLNALQNPISEERLSDDHFGLYCENNKSIMLYRNTSDRKIYRTVGRCINNDTKELAILYRKWDDFGDSFESLYSRDYKNFHKYFEEIQYQGIKLNITLK